mmetsp:Transcript_12097/g.28690  ORF Transcript_12097/g.28690 Transcript_12097/m.28690 type:complete len:478 (+) Transcript_12097:167-1600(+)|eukprot:CAMPEP_0197194652 /NCGR_PEP_ID=MMETSP1423-20130617/29640_1 /TAXON_ID=476441 /ORGANISM="Pseudo-nitzschia heimii, Strain UNC1101" /LENGTH=477 /DNA_ID=CAMNT_0042648107 /DNA_START=132 /DNA_END=1565 /DNA_ORIENTATION=+
MSITNDEAIIPRRKGAGDDFDGDISDGKIAISEKLLGRSITLAGSTPKPFVVFSTTSSSQSLVDIDCQDENSEWIQAEDEDGQNCDDNFDDEASALSASRATSTELTGMAMVGGPMKAETKSHRFWTTRITELVLVYIILLASVVVYVQNTNRLYLSSAVVVTGSEARAELLPPLNTATTTSSHDKSIRTENCIYAPGGGFSGFWYSLGRLQSIGNPYNETFVCYSAGCLGVVATLLHHGELAKNNNTAIGTDLENNDSHNRDHYLQVYEMARGIQIDMQSGKMHRYRVVESFVDGLLEKLEGYADDDEFRILFLDTIRSNLNVITTLFDDQGPHDDQSISNGVGISSQQLLPLPPLSILPRAVVRRPSDIPSLRRLLIQSAWIPLVTGSSWTDRGHMDGGLSKVQHPRCSQTVGFTKTESVTANSNEDGNTTSAESPSTWLQNLRNRVTLLANTVNIEIKQEDVDQLWRTGMEVGV